MGSPSFPLKLCTLSQSKQEVSGSFQKILPLVVMAVECKVKSCGGFGPSVREC